MISRWLFRDGGKYNLAIARVAVGFSLLFTLNYKEQFSAMALHWNFWKTSRDGAGWTPKGLIKIVDLFTDGPPSGEFTKIVFMISLVSIVAMIVGLWSWPSQIVATVTA